MDTREKKETALGLLLGLLGVGAFCILYYQSSYLITKHVWSMGTVVDVLLGGAAILLINCFLRWKYRYWFPKDDAFFTEWRQEWRKQQRYLLLTGSVVMLAAVLVLIYTIRTRTFIYGYVVNYAFAYFLVFTVLFLLGLLEWRIIVFMKKQLNKMMDVVHEVNRERLNEAIEIERQSLEKAAKSEQLKVNLISNVSHDLKTPLTSMVGYLELLKKENLGESARDYVEVISDKAEKLKVMIESLFSLAKASSGNIQFKQEPIELNRLIE